MKLKESHEDLANIHKTVLEFFGQKNNNSIQSVYATGSIVRGDYNPESSDQDLLVVFSNSVSGLEMNKTIAELSQFLASQKITPRPDILYMPTSQLPLSTEDMLTTPFSKFSIFGFDTKANHKLLYGSDIFKKFTPLEPQQHVDTFIAHFLKKVTTADTYKDLVIQSCQLIRCIFIKNGIVTLDKDELREAVDILPYENKIKNYIRQHPNLSGKHFPYDIFRKRTNTFVIKIKPFIAKGE